MNDFFAALYELITGQSDLANLLFDDQKYFLMGIVMLTVSGLTMAIYYYVINHTRFNRWWHWLIMTAVAGTINFFSAFFIADGILWEKFGTTENYFADKLNFAIADAIWAFVFAFVFSMCIKWKSSNAKHSPF